VRQSSFFCFFDFLRASWPLLFFLWACFRCSRLEMVVLADIRSEFYHDLLGKRVLVYVVSDIDGICAWRILKELFIYKEILYTLLVVPDKKELLVSYNTHKDSSDDDSAGESENEEKLSNPGAIEKRVEKRKWLRHRQDILMDYESFSYFTVSSSIVLFDLAWRLSQENNCLLWYAIVGQTSQLLTYSINREHYIDQLDYLQSHVSRLGHAVQTHSATSVVEESKAKVEIAFEDDLALWLYKHWSLKETMETSMLTASRFKLFTESGQKRLLEFLVHIGLPRREYLQRYSTMSSAVKENLNGLLIQHGEKYGLNRRDLFIPSFTVQLGYRTPISAMDAVLLTISALEYYVCFDEVFCYVITILSPSDDVVISALLNVC
ncbi:Cell division control protein 45, partial [Fasciola hepatica]